MRLNPLFAPETLPKPKPLTRCKRRCCWTPFGHAARKGCTCHPKGT